MTEGEVFTHTYAVFYRERERRVHTGRKHLKRLYLFKIHNYNSF